MSDCEETDLDILIVWVSDKDVSLEGDGHGLGVEKLSSGAPPGPGDQHQVRVPGPGQAAAAPAAPVVDTDWPPPTSGSWPPTPQSHSYSWAGPGPRQWAGLRPEAFPGGEAGVLEARDYEGAGPDVPAVDPHPDLVSALSRQSVDYVILPTGDCHNLNSSRCIVWHGYLHTRLHLDESRQWGDVQVPEVLDVAWDVWEAGAWAHLWVAVPACRI